MEDHSEWLERVSASLDGELSPEEDALLREHLETCGICRSALALLRSMQTAMGSEEVQPPEQLAKGARFLYEQERKRRGLDLRRWRFTAIAAVLCLALLGVAKLAPWSGGSRKTAAADAAPEAAERGVLMAVAGYTDTTADSAPNGMPAENAEAPEYSGAGGAMPEPAPMATAYGIPAEAADDGMRAGGSNGAAEPESVEEEPAADASKSSMYYTAALPGYSVYRQLQDAEGYYSVSFVYGPVPEEIRNNSACTPLDSPEGQERWLVPLEICQNEGYLEQFNEIYYGDLLSRLGLVIGLLDVEEERLP